MKVLIGVAAMAVGIGLHMLLCSTGPIYNEHFNYESLVNWAGVFGRSAPGVIASLAFGVFLKVVHACRNHWLLPLNIGLYAGALLRLVDFQ